MMNIKIFSNQYNKYINECRLYVPKHFFNGNEGCFGYCPCDVQVFEKVLGDMIQNGKQGFEFLEIGCGIPLFSLCIGKAFENIQITGIEYNKKICDYVNSTALSDNIEIIYKDANKYKEYDKYDFMFMPQPLQDTLKMHNLLLYILKNMKQGAILYICTTNLYKVKDFKKEIEAFADIKRMDSDYVYKLVKI